MVMVYILFSFFLPVFTGFGVPAISNYCVSDTVIISSKGTNNQVLIDSVEFSTNAADTLNLPFTGSISQSGSANKTEINTNPSIHKTNGKLNKVVVKQTGTNNSVKINSH